MRKRVSIFTAVFLFVSVLLTQGVFAIVDKSEEYYVADYAGVLSSATETEIINLNDYLEHYCSGAQIVVVSVEYLDGMYSDEYAIQLFNDWGVGSKEENNGMLLLFSTEENKGWLTTGAGISNSFSDDTANSYLDKYFWGDFDAGKYDSAVQSLLKALTGWYDNYYNTNILGEYYGIEDNSYSTSMSTASILYNIFTRLLVVAVFLSVFFAMRSADRRRYNAYYMHMGMPIPPYHFWYMWSMMPHRRWNNPNDRGPKGPGGFGGGGFGGGFGGGSGFGGGGFSGGGGGGRR